jgi:hypothetical protein
MAAWKSVRRRWRQWESVLSMRWKRDLHVPRRERREGTSRKEDIVRKSFSDRLDASKTQSKKREKGSRKR